MISSLISRRGRLQPRDSGPCVPGGPGMPNGTGGPNGTGVPPAPAPAPGVPPTPGVPPGPGPIPVPGTPGGPDGTGVPPGPGPAPAPGVPPAPGMPGGPDVTGAPGVPCAPGVPPTISSMISRRGRLQPRDSGPCVPGGPGMPNGTGGPDGTGVPPGPGPAPASGVSPAPGMPGGPDGTGAPGVPCPPSVPPTISSMISRRGRLQPHDSGACVPGGPGMPGGTGGPDGTGAPGMPSAPGMPGPGGPDMTAGTPGGPAPGPSGPTAPGTPAPCTIPPNTSGGSDMTGGPATPGSAPSGPSAPGSSSDGSGAPATPPVCPTPQGGSIRVVPLIAMGVFDLANGPRYKTTIQITNTGLSTVTASAEFFNADGTPLTVPLNANIDGVSTFTSSLKDFALPPNSTTTITTGDSSSAAVGWGRITSSSHVSIATFFDLSELTTGALRSRLWLPPSDTDLRRFALPRARNVNTGSDAGFVVVNTGLSSAIFTSTLLDASGAILASKTTTLAPLQQLSLFAQEHFALAREASGPYQSFIVFDSTSAQFAAVGVAYDANGLLSLPVDRIPEEGSIGK
jgi:hypothetical protein